jgi:hypothetical protein
MSARNPTYEIQRSEISRFQKTMEGSIELNNLCARRTTPVQNRNVALPEVNYGNMCTSLDVQKNLAAWNQCRGLENFSEDEKLKCYGCWKKQEEIRKLFQITLKTTY